MAQVVTSKDGISRNELNFASPSLGLRNLGFREIDSEKRDEYAEDEESGYLVLHYSSAS